MWYKVEPGFAPAGEAHLFRQKAPKPFPPRSSTFNRADEDNGEADQLAGLRQGPPICLSVSPVGRPAGGASLGVACRCAWLAWAQILRGAHVLSEVEWIRMTMRGEECRREDGSPITAVGDDGEEVLGDEVIFGLGSDSSAWPQNDKVRGNELEDMEAEDVAARVVFRLGQDSSPWAQNDSYKKGLTELQEKRILFASAF